MYTECIINSVMFGVKKSYFGNFFKVYFSAFKKILK